MPAKKSPKSASTKSAKTAKSPSGEKPTAVTRKKRTPGKSTPKLAPSFTLERKAPAVEPVIHHDEIALRAYYIGERRQKMGWAGDPGTDWADAVSQLRAEALEKPLKKR